MTGGRRLCLCAGLLLPLASSALALRTQQPERPGEQPEALPPGALGVVFSGEQNGYLTPCGCTKPMLGGVPRRATYLRSQKLDSPLVRVDNGDLTPGMGRQDELKAETLVELLADLQYDAINLGEADYRFGLPYLRSLQERSHGRLLGGNARGEAGDPLFPEFVVVRRPVAGKPVRVAVVGLLSMRLAEEVAGGPELRFEPPEATLARLEPRLAAEADLRVLLYHGPRAEATELARQYPGFQLVVTAHDGDPPPPPARAGKTTLVTAGLDGKYVGLATCTQGERWGVEAAKTVALTPAIHEDPAALATLAVYLDRVTAEDLLGQVIKTPTENGDAFAGSAACAGCHAPATRAWEASGHARALQTLVREKHDRDPDCVGCHVVGLDRVGGFASVEKTPHLEHVGCESCHGAAARHVRDPQTPMPKVGAAGCRACHDPRNSPRFDFGTYWPRIQH